VQGREGVGGIFNSALGKEGKYVGLTLIDFEKMDLCVKISLTKNDGKTNNHR
jgi:hypothetical protein